MPFVALVEIKLFQFDTIALVVEAILIYIGKYGYALVNYCCCRLRAEKKLIQTSDIRWQHC